MGLRGLCGVQGIRPESAACTSSVLSAEPLLGPVRDLLRVVTTQTRHELTHRPQGLPSPGPLSLCRSAVPEAWLWAHPYV